MAGATSDIGEAVTRSLVELGWSVIAVGRNEERLAVLANLSPVIAVRADLTTDAGRTAVGDELRRLDGLDALVLGSGSYVRSSEPEQLMSQFEANVAAPYALIHAALPQLRSRRGTVIVLNSTQGLRAAAGVGQFAATQHAMKAVTDSLRDEVNADGVRVCSVFLGRTATGRQRRIFAMEDRPYTPELLIQPADVAHVVASVIQLPATAEITDVTMRPTAKS